jgi:hypothetical protein
MSNTIKSLLPPLHDGHRVPAVESRGAWQVLGDGDLLEVIARGLNTGEKLQGTIDRYRIGA